jgi:hypothetical protein
MLKSLSATELARLLASVEPKVKGETASSFRLIIEGFENRRCPMCGFVMSAGPKNDEGENGNG